MRSECQYIGYGESSSLYVCFYPQEPTIRGTGSDPTEAKIDLISRERPDKIGSLHIGKIGNHFVYHRGDEVYLARTIDDLLKSAFWPIETRPVTYRWDRDRWLVSVNHGFVMGHPQLRVAYEQAASVETVEQYKDYDFQMVGDKYHATRGSCTGVAKTVAEAVKHLEDQMFDCLIESQFGGILDPWLRDFAYKYLNDLKERKR